MTETKSIENEAKSEVGAFLLPPLFWERVVAAPQRQLLLDYDGTLAPFRVKREEAHALSGVLDLLRKIQAQCHTQLAIVSGRPLIELLTLVGSLPAALVAGHGFETLDENMTLRRQFLLRRQLDLLERAAGQALNRGLGPYLEKKKSSLAFHTRGCTSDVARLVEAGVREILAYGDWREVALHKFDGGWELRIEGIDKGKAVRDLLRGVSADTMVVYIGDDETDEDAFLELPAEAIGLRVGDFASSTAAAGRIRDCEGVRDFLQQWFDRTREEGHG